MNIGAFPVFLAAALSAGSLVAASAHAQASKERFRGAYVCAKLPTTSDILRAPLDLVVDGTTVWFARPLFNPDGSRVVGSELASGTIDEHRTVHLTSQWSFRGNSARGDYSGTLGPTGGTLTGTQVWRGPDGTIPVSRNCTAALVPAFHHTAAPQQPDGQ